MADISKEIAKKDAQKLFDSIGKFTSSGWVTTGEEGNTLDEVKRIIKKYKDGNDLNLLESLYEEIYNTGVNTTLKGEFTGQQRLKDRLEKLKKENPNRSLLELDLIDEGREFSIKGGQAQFERPFDLYNKHKSEIPSYVAPNSDITLEGITERFQGGNKTNPLTVDDINALDNKNAIDLIINNKIPLTDEARGTLFSFLKFSPQEYQDNFKSTYYSQEEIDRMQGAEYTDQTDETIPVVDPDIMLHETLDTPDVPQESTEVTPEVVADEVVEPTVTTDTKEVTTEKTKSEKLAGAGNALLKGAGAVLDSIGGPGAIISYVMGKKGLKAAMKEVEPKAKAELSPMFMQHLRQTRELAKKGFHPDQARKFRKELDKSYQIGLENAVRGSGGQRAKFLAQSGVLDAQRSSALLDYAAKDEELQSKNQDKYEKMMLFKENFDIQRTESERAEDMEKQVADKKAAAGFTSAAFTNLLSGFGRSSLVPNPAPGTTNIYNQLPTLGLKE